MGKRGKYTPFQAYVDTERELSYMRSQRKFGPRNPMSGPALERRILKESLAGLAFFIALSAAGCGACYLIDKYSDSNIESTTLDNNDEKTYEAGEHTVVKSVKEDELNNSVNNIPDGYKFDKIVENSDSKMYDVYYTNTEKVLATDNSFGTIIESNKTLKYTPNNNGDK